MGLHCLCLALLALSISDATQEWRADTLATPRPVAPYVVKNACPYEGCSLGTTVADSPQPVYRGEGDTTEIVFRLAPGDTFVSVAANLHLERLGEVLVKAPFAAFAAGDTLLILGYEGEDSFPVWHDGLIYHVGLSWWIPPDQTAPDDLPEWSDEGLRGQAVMIAAPLMDWWIHIRRGDREGYLRLRNLTNYGFYWGG